jgi:hypothetical protein
VAHAPERVDQRRPGRARRPPRGRSSASIGADQVVLAAAKDELGDHLAGKLGELALGELATSSALAYRRIVFLAL